MFLNSFGSTAEFDSSSTVLTPSSPPPSFLNHPPAPPVLPRPTYQQLQPIIEIQEAQLMALRQRFTELRSGLVEVRKELRMLRKRRQFF